MGSSSSSSVIFVAIVLVAVVAVVFALPASHMGEDEAKPADCFGANCREKRGADDSTEEDVPSLPYLRMEGTERKAETGCRGAADEAVAVPFKKKDRLTEKDCKPYEFFIEELQICRNLTRVN